MRAAAAALALGLLAAPLVAQEEGPSPLERALSGLDSGASVAATARGIRSLGAAVAPEVLAALSAELAASSARAARESSRLEALLLGAEGLGRSALAPLWTTALAGEDLDRRVAAIRLAGVAGGSGDLRLVLGAAEGDAGSREAAGRAVEAMLQRSPGTLSALRREITSVSVELAGRLIRALASSPDEGVPGVLVDLLGFEAALDLPLLSQLSGCVRRHGHVVDEAWAERVRPFLHHGDREAVRAALDALGALQDAASLEEMVAASALPDAGLAAAAFAALRETSGLRLPDRTERWSAWLAAEREWQAQRGPALRQALAGDDEVRICSALRELGLHRIDRRLQASLAVPLLEHPSPSVRVAACRLLGELGPGTARGALERAAEDRAPAVAAAALAALGPDRTSAVTSPGR